MALSISPFVILAFLGGLLLLFWLVTRRLEIVRRERDEALARLRTDEPTGQP